MDRTRVIVLTSWATLVLSVVGWPLTSVTIFRGEPQGVLALSWLALILGAANTLLTAYVRSDTHDEQET